MQAEKKLNNPFSALSHSNFRIYWIGMCISLIGTWMQNIAQPWYALTLTNNAFLVSLISTVQFLPTLLFSLVSGVLLDKMDKRKVLIVTQASFMLISAIFAVLAYSNHLQYIHILILALLMGLVNSMDMPARQSFIIELVGKEDLMNGIALNSMAFNVARVLGPAVAGVAMLAFGAASCFLINTISFMAVLISLFFIKTTNPQIKSNGKINLIQEIKEGLAYVAKKKVLYASLVVLLIVGTFAPNFTILVSAYSKYILKGNESTFGLLISFLGIGSFFGASYIAATSKAGPKKSIILLFPFIIGTLLCISGLVTSFVILGILLATVGFFFVAFTSSVNTALQLNTTNEYRGRVMSLYTLVFSGSTPFGSLYAGWFTNTYGAPVGFFSAGLAVIVLMIPFLLFLYLKKKG